jgi:flagellar motility protein MotE (MotC chaperone)
VRTIVVTALIVFAMTLTFLALGMAKLYMTGVGGNLDQIWNILSGKPTPQTTQTQRGISQDALRELGLQQSELKRNIRQLREERDRLSLEAASKLDFIETDSPEPDTAERARIREKVIAMFNDLNPANAAAILDLAKDDTVLWLLPKLDTDQAGRILSALRDDQRKALLAEKLIDIP